MKAVIVTPFDNYSYNVRIKYVEKYLMALGYDVKILSSDFDHREKKTYNLNRKRLELIHVPEYKKNLSLDRMYSHYIFAKKVVARIKEINPDFIYGSIPPNFIVKFISEYKKKNPKVNLIYEVGDLWPETLPLSNYLKRLSYPILKTWGLLRDNYLNYGDGIIFECELFKNVLSKSLGETPGKTIYLCKENSRPDEFQPIISDVLCFVYIGSINNTIDVNLIIEFLNEVKLYRKVKLEIIGKGENLSNLHDSCKKYDIDYIDHGAIYDETIKCNILQHCQFGFNIMKESVAVGVTMKSLEYFHWGIGVINNIPADTADIISRDECGLNICKNDFKKAAKRIGTMTTLEIIRMMSNSRNVYLKHFDERIISSQFIDFYKKVVKI